jgi:hypothetical protein
MTEEVSNKQVCKKVIKKIFLDLIMLRFHSETHFLTPRMESFVVVRFFMWRC